LIDMFDLKLLFTDQATSDERMIDLRILAQVAAKLETASRSWANYHHQDVTTIKFTSGSSGEPKGLAATVGSIDSSIGAVQELFRHEASDRLFVFLPLSLLQQRYWIYSALYYGHDVIISNYELALYAVKREEPSVIMGVPSFYDAVKRQVERQNQAAEGDRAESADETDGGIDGSINADLGRRRRLIELTLGKRIRYLWTGSAPASVEMLRFFFDCGIPIYEGYGMNETCIVTKNHPAAVKIGSVGKPLARKEVKINENGIVVVRSGYPVNTKYQYAPPAESEKQFQPNGDVVTGDLGYIDPEGYLYIVGRADDVVVLGNGKNIAVRSIEERMKASPAVEECIIYGAGRPYLLAVISKPDDASEWDIVEHIRDINAGTAPDERIGKYIIAKERFTIDNGLLTSQYKPKRKEIFSRYKPEIERVYQHGGVL
jgi:long-chain acyl-CoA synthetase